MYTDGCCSSLFGVSFFLVILNFCYQNKVVVQRKEGNSLILTLVKNVSNDENRFKRINVQKIASLKDLFNSPINKISFNVKSIKQIQEISKFLNQDGKTQVKFNLSTEDQILNFQLKKPMNLDRKSLNLLRKQQIQAEIS